MYQRLNRRHETYFLIQMINFKKILKMNPNQLKKKKEDEEKLKKLTEKAKEKGTGAKYDEV
jgi:hypothetical protein